MINDDLNKTQPADKKGKVEIKKDLLEEDQSQTYRLESDPSTNGQNLDQRREVESSTT